MGEGDTGTADMDDEIVEQMEGQLEAHMVVSEFGHEFVERNGLARHVYTGLCDDVMTKWVTVQPWNGKIRFAGGVYMDSNGREILVFEEDESEYNDW